MNDSRKEASTWFYHLRDLICAEINKIEEESGSEARMIIQPWSRTTGVGGEHAIMRDGAIFEKVAVNVSVVDSEFSEEFAKKIPGTENSRKFWASGISVIAHMRSPLIPAIHLNTRHICTEKRWIGGGIDMTPSYIDADEKRHFHQKLKELCDKFDPEYYDRFSKWCSEYFYVKHRQRERGIGGIFYDYIDIGNWEHDLAFTKAVGLTFLNIFMPLVKRKMLLPWTEEDKAAQLKTQALYAEFILLYDRGTKFGLETGGNVDSILSSLPPVATW